MGIAVAYTSMAPDAVEQARCDQAVWETLLGSPGNVEGAGFGICCYKTWDGLWYLLDPARRAGGDVPESLLGRAVMGAEAVPPPDTTFGSTPGRVYEGVRYVTEEEAQRASAAMNEMAPETLWECFDPAWLSGWDALHAKRDPWWQEREAHFATAHQKRREWRGYHAPTPEGVWSLFEKVREVYADAAMSGNGVVVSWM